MKLAERLAGMMPEGLVGESSPETYERLDAWGDTAMAFVDFPLSGDPSHDVLAVYDKPERVPDAFGLGGMLEWSMSLRYGVQVGIAVDTSDDDKAGAYLRHNGRVDLVEPFMASIGEDYEPYMDAWESLPWLSTYAGAFPERGHVTRIGGPMMAPPIGRDEWLRECMGQLGLSVGSVPNVLWRLLGDTSHLEYQLDVTDGFADTMAFAVLTPDMDALARHDEALREMGLSDGRAQSLPPDVVPNALKVRFVEGEPTEARCYVMLRADR